MSSYKVCSTCKIEKELTVNNFQKDKSRKSGFYPECKTCRVISRKRSFEKHKEKILAQSRAYHKATPEKQRARHQRYYQANKAKRLAYSAKYHINRYKTDESYRTADQFRRAVNEALKLNYKVFREGSRASQLQCSLEFFRSYIESQFVNGMTWENRGKLWEIDHIKPLSKFDLRHESEKLAAFHYSNHRPLLLTENRRKYNKWLEIHDNHKI